MAFTDKIVLIYQYKTDNSIQTIVNYVMQLKNKLDDTFHLNAFTDASEIIYYL
jgi:hypothetical protein